MSRCRAVTLRLNSSKSLSQSSAASPLRGDELVKGCQSFDSQTQRFALGRSLEDALVWFAEEALQTQQNGLDIVCCRPLVLEDIQADAAGEVDVWVVDWRLKEHRRGRVWVVCRESKAELEGQTSVWCSVGAFDGGGPGQQVAICRGERRNARCGRGHELHKLRLQAGPS